MSNSDSTKEQLINSAIETLDYTHKAIVKSIKINDSYSENFIINLSDTYITNLFIISRLRGSKEIEKQFPLLSKRCNGGS